MDAHRQLTWLLNTVQTAVSEDALKYEAQAPHTSSWVVRLHRIINNRQESTKNKFLISTSHPTSSHHPTFGGHTSIFTTGLLNPKCSYVRPLGNRPFCNVEPCRWPVSQQHSVGAAYIQKWQHTRTLYNPCTARSPALTQIQGSQVMFEKNTLIQFVTLRLLIITQ